MKYHTCASIAQGTPKKMRAVLDMALKKSQYVELRLDFLRPSQVPLALELSKDVMDRCVCTLRPKSQGGMFSGTEKERVSILKLISEYNPYMIDIEYSAISKDTGLQRYVKKTGTRVLVSWHDHKKTPDTPYLKKRLAQMQSLSSHVKIVTLARTPQDASRVLSLYGKKSKGGLVAFAMGEAGRFSRILCLYMGSPYTYVSLGKATAPGQFSAEQVRRIVDN